MGKVEEVARAIWADREKAAAAIGIPLPAWEFESDELRSDVRREARAAIEAMREPTKAMVDAAGDTAHHEDDTLPFKAVFDKYWQAAIAAAIRSGS